MRMQVRDLMTGDVVAVHPEDTLARVRDLMAERDVRHMPVVDDGGELVGLITQRDLLRNALIQQADVPDFVENVILEKLLVQELMNTGIASTTPDTDIRDAAQVMFENKFGCLPVIEGELLVGILTEADFVRLFAEGH